jgi:TRAP-type uncharacterized transport system substrate-binding protein
MPTYADQMKADLEVHLEFIGDWGVANWHLAMGWIAAGMRWRTARNSTWVIHTISGDEIPLDSVLDGRVDMAITTPVSHGGMAYEGRGLYDKPHPHLRAIAALPHRDRLVLAVGTDVAERYGLRTVADLVEKRPPLKVITGVNDGKNSIGFTVDKILEAYGAGWDEFERWGGEWVIVERPRHGMVMVGKGEADALFFEAVMTWHQLIERRPLTFLPIEPSVLDELYQKYGLVRADIEPGEHEGVDYPVPTVDFSDWLFCVRADMPDEVARLIAEVMVEDRAVFEGRYTHMPVERSPLHYPIRAEKICQTGPVPLHPGAERYFREIGALT